MDTIKISVRKTETATSVLPEAWLGLSSVSISKKFQFLALKLEFEWDNPRQSWAVIGPPQPAVSL